MRVENITDIELDVLPDPDPATNPEPSTGFGEGAEGGRVEAIAISPDGGYFVTSDDTGNARVWNTNQSWDTVAPAADRAGYIRKYSFNPQTRSIYAVSGIGGFAGVPTPNAELATEQLLRADNDDEWDEWVTPRSDPIQLCEGLKTDYRELNL